MKRIAQYFLRGLVVTTPVFLTLYVCWWIVSRVDRMIDVGIQGAEARTGTEGDGGHGDVA